ncbi:unnamed protein product [Effrenium voratum]|uniref:Uncharacterized protein n=1 Tax=Effrenium voratum TaxID=2562239 RepID=A0AA36JHN8_9DINO|nr:unnamed protein product [Effrenium voratum]
MAPRRCAVLALSLVALTAGVFSVVGSCFAGALSPRRSPACHVRMAGPEGTKTYELWVDFRAQRLKKPQRTLQVSCGKVSLSPADGAASSLQAPQVKEGLLQLARGLREKFTKIGVEMPKGKLVNGVIVDKKFAKEVLEDLRDLQTPVYTARKEVDGETMHGSGFFVCTAADGKPVACLAPKQVRLSSTMPHAEEDVYGLEEDSSKEDREKQEAEEMQRYKEGLDDPSKYVLPPRKRMRELFGLPPEPRKPNKDRLLAKTLPPDALLWGRALMDRQRTGPVGYNLVIDRDAKATPISRRS